MSAETAWKVARDEIATQLEVAGQAFSLPSSELAGKALTGAAAALRALPMPPAFAAAVEAETRELREMLRRCVNAMGGEARYEDDVADMLEYGAALGAGRALLSRMEGKP